MVTRREEWRGWERGEGDQCMMMTKTKLGGEHAMLYTEVEIQCTH